MTSTIHWHCEDLWQKLSPRLPGLTVEVLPSIDSTNTELTRRARAGDTAPALLIAEQQTAGRGRQGRPWVNAPGDCLMYSLGLVLAPADWAGLSLVAGLSVAEALHADPHDGDDTHDAAAPGAPAPSTVQPRIGIKWPNDLWVDGSRKLGGTLIETSNLPATAHPVQPIARVAGKQDATPRYVVIGTGINIRAPHSGDGLSIPPVGLQELDPRWSAPLALGRILPQLVQDVLTFGAHGFAPFKERFARVDWLRGRPVHLAGGTIDSMEGIAEGVANSGALLIRTPHGVQAIHSGEVSVRPQGMPLPAHNR